MPPLVPIRRPNSVTLDINGYGYAAITCPSGCRWSIKLVSVSTTATATAGTPQPLCTLYEGQSPNPAAFIEGTYSGNRDTSNSVHELGPGDSICAEWVGGTPGSVATIRIAGLQVQV